MHFQWWRQWWWWRFDEIWSPILATNTSHQLSATPCNFLLLIIWWGQTPHLLHHPGSCPAKITSPTPQLTADTPPTFKCHTPDLPLANQAFPLPGQLLLGSYSLKSFQHQSRPRTYSWKLNSSTGLSYHCDMEQIHPICDVIYRRHPLLKWMPTCKSYACLNHLSYVFVSSPPL